MPAAWLSASERATREVEHGSDRGCRITLGSPAPRPQRLLYRAPEQALTSALDALRHPTPSDNMCHPSASVSSGSRLKGSSSATRVTVRSKGSATTRFQRLTLAASLRSRGAATPNCSPFSEARSRPSSGPARQRYRVRASPHPPATKPEPGRDLPDHDQCWRPWLRLPGHQRIAHGEGWRLWERSHHNHPPAGPQFGCERHRALRCAELPGTSLPPINHHQACDQQPRDLRVPRRLVPGPAHLPLLDGSGALVQHPALSTPSRVAASIDRKSRGLGKGVSVSVWLGPVADRRHGRRWRIQ